MFRFIIYQIDRDNDQFTNRPFYERSSMFFNKDHAKQAMAERRYKRVASIHARNLNEVRFKASKPGYLLDHVPKLEVGDVIESEKYGNQYIVANTGFDSLNEIIL